MEILYFLVIGLISGWLAGIVMKGRGSGILGNIIIGVIGSVLGGFLFRIIGLSARGPIGSIITAFAGAVVLLVIIGVLKKA